jgi:hypothetical protein
MLSDMLANYRNTLFCNISQYSEFRDTNTVPGLKIIGSLWVPINTVYVVDDDGQFQKVSIDEKELFSTDFSLDQDDDDLEWLNELQPGESSISSDEDDYGDEDDRGDV